MEYCLTPSRISLSARTSTVSKSCVIELRICVAVFEKPRVQHSCLDGVPETRKHRFGVVVYAFGVHPAELHTDL